MKKKTRSKFKLCNCNKDLSFDLVECYVHLAMPFIIQKSATIYFKHILWFVCSCVHTINVQMKLLYFSPHCNYHNDCTVHGINVAKDCLVMSLNR